MSNSEFFIILISIIILLFLVFCAILRFILGTGAIINRLTTIKQHTKQQAEIFEEIKLLLNDIRILLVSLDEKTH